MLLQTLANNTKVCIASVQTTLRSSTTMADDSWIDENGNKLFRNPGKTKSRVWDFFGFRKNNDGPPSKRNLDTDKVVCTLCKKTYTNKGYSLYIRPDTFRNRIKIICWFIIEVTYFLLNCRSSTSFILLDLRFFLDLDLLQFLQNVNVYFIFIYYMYYAK